MFGKRGIRWLLGILRTVLAVLLRNWNVGTVQGTIRYGTVLYGTVSFVTVNIGYLLY